MPPRNVMLILGTVLVAFACHLKAERSRYAAQIGEAMKLIEDLYVDEVPSRQVFENAMEGMALGLDQYSQYIRPEDFQQMNQVLDQEFGGVGIEVEKSADSQPIVILSPLVGSPGYRAGLRAGDEILAIDGVSTIGMKQQDAVPRMRGQPGTKVTLRVRHPGQDGEVEIVVTRDVIKVDSLLGESRNESGGWDFRLSQDRRIGYLRLTTFGQHSATELEAALGGGKSCPFDALILDLRNNAGGLLDVAVDVCDMFLDRGRIVSTRGRDGVDRSVFEATPPLTIPNFIPIVVLVNRYSASASEIVAACLQDHGRAVIVGERTWGKGTVQNLLQLEGGRSALKLTTASYWRPSGKNIHRRKDEPETAEWGVRPDSGFEVQLTDAEFERVLKSRRERDLKRLERPTTEPNDPLDTLEPTTQAAPTDGASEVVDPQLQKAVLYLQSKLPRLDAVQVTATTGVRRGPQP